MRPASPVNRRAFVLGLAASSAVPTAATAGTGGVGDQISRLAARLAHAGHRTNARFHLGRPDDPRMRTLRQGHAAWSIVPSLRRLSADEQALPDAQALLAETAAAIGRYALLVGAAIDQLAAAGAHPVVRHLHRRMAVLPDHDADDEFGRTSFAILRQGRAEVRELVRRRGAGAVLAELRVGLSAVEVEAGAPSCPEPWEPAPRAIAIAAGVLLIGATVVAGGAIGMITACGFAFGGAFTGILLVILGGLVISSMLYLAILAITKGADAGPRVTADGRRLIAVVRPDCGWLATGLALDGEAPLVEVGGVLAIEGIPESVDARGYGSDGAGADALAPDLPLGALLARLDEWVGPVLGGARSLEAGGRSGLLDLALNLPTSSACRGRFRVRMDLPEPEQG